MLHAATEPFVIADFMSPQGVALWWTVNIYDSLSRVAVPLFVMLGGALLLQPAKAEEPLREFFRKRIDRIALPFVFWSAAYFAWRIFVNGEPVSADLFAQGLLEGPYYHFWFLYLIIGLYLLTPVLRILLAHAHRTLVRYFLILWVTGTATVPFLTAVVGFNVSVNVFLITGWVGYFILGTYLTGTRSRPKLFAALVVVGYLVTVVGTYLVVGTVGERVSQVFHDATSVTIIAASSGLFLLLSAFSQSQVEARFPHGYRLLHAISINTLPIYLFHVMVLETLQKGYLGFTISLGTMNAIIEVPLITAITLLICLALVYAAKKIPYVAKIIG